VSDTPATPSARARQRRAGGRKTVTAASCLSTHQAPRRETRGGRSAPQTAGERAYLKPTDGGNIALPRKALGVARADLRRRGCHSRLRGHVLRAVLLLAPVLKFVDALLRTATKECKRGRCVSRLVRSATPTRLHFASFEMKIMSVQARAGRHRRLCCSLCKLRSICQNSARVLTPAEATDMRLTGEAATRRTRTSPPSCAALCHVRWRAVFTFARPPPPNCGGPSQHGSP
jgi:hypothetical protein